MKQKFSIAMSLAVILAMLLTSFALASAVDVAVVDVTAPTGSVTLTPGGSGAITINMSVTGKQEGTATFEVYRDWTLSGGAFTGSNPVEFTVDARAAGDAADTFSTSGTVSIDASQGAGTFTLSVGAFDITNTNTTGAKLSAGASASYQVTVSAPPPPPSDATAPDTTITANPANPTNSTSASFSFTGSDNVTPAASLTFECSLDGGAFGACVSPQPYSGLLDGSHTFQVRAKDAANLVDPTPASFTWLVDTIAPTVTATPDRAADHNGWYNHPLTISFIAPDAASCDPAVTYSGPDSATASVSGTCKDAAGNVGSDDFGFQYDATAPMITAALDKSADSVTGWFNQVTGAPTVQFTCSDATSEIDSCPGDHLFGEGADQSWSDTASDNAGNSASDGVSDVDVDLTAPSITITTPANGASYLLNQAVAANYGCTDGTSGVATCAGPVANGANIDTTVGSKSFTVDATDVAGNASSLTNNYTVSYKICALYDQNKSHKKGSTVPVKLQLCDYNNVNVSSPSIIVHATGVVKVDASASGTLDDSGYANSPEYDFRYDASLAGYIFNLSTKPLSTGTWKVTFTVGGAGSYSVQFDVK